MTCPTSMYRGSNSDLTSSLTVRPEAIFLAWSWYCGATWGGQTLTKPQNTDKLCSNVPGCCLAALTFTSAGISHHGIGCNHPLPLHAELVPLGASATPA